MLYQMTKKDNGSKTLKAKARIIKPAAPLPPNGSKPKVVKKKPDPDRKKKVVAKLAAKVSKAVAARRPKYEPWSKAEIRTIMAKSHPSDVVLAKQMKRSQSAIQKKRHMVKVALGEV